MEIIVILAIAAIGVLGVFIARTSKSKSRWGLGAFTGTNCPRCGTKLPMFRRPTSKEETLWGGWTCPKCGCKVDKYGKERAAT